ncbi:TIGR04255 family protein [Agromyces sp. NPDC058104]|uniref:TIGR04255 family protein n=1 Tax=Agromyces sp. NPDC058104 TaxID=3346342 RepID=UPI0036DF0D99
MTDRQRITEDEDGPYGGLPPADRTLLLDPPIEVAIIEIQHSTSISTITAEDAIAIRDEVQTATETDYPTIQQAVRQQVQVTASEERPLHIEDAFHGWQFATADGRKTITVVPGTLVLQVTDYERWRTSLREPLQALLTAIIDRVEPQLVHRIGLRYVDRLRDGRESIADWRGRISDSLLGPIGNEVFGDAVSTAQQQIEIELDSHRRAILRHGTLMDSGSLATDYLIDIDVFDQRTTRFDAETVLATAVRLNRTSVSLFQACLDPAYFKTLRKGESE